MTMKLWCNSISTYRSRRQQGICRRCTWWQRRGFEQQSQTVFVWITEMSFELLDISDKCHERRCYSWKRKLVRDTWYCLVFSTASYLDLGIDFRWVHVAAEEENLTAELFAALGGSWRLCKWSVDICNKIHQCIRFIRQTTNAIDINGVIKSKEARTPYHRERKEGCP